MNTIDNKIESNKAENARITLDSLIVDLSDGRTIAVPLEWFPRLLHATRKERNNWRFIGGGLGIHWEDVDEDISVQGLFDGRPSGESLSSFKSWLEKGKRQKSNGSVKRTSTARRLG